MTTSNQSESFAGSLSATSDIHYKPDDDAFFLISEDRKLDEADLNSSIASTPPSDNGNSV